MTTQPTLRVKVGWVVIEYLGDRWSPKLYEEVIYANFEGILTSRPQFFGHSNGERINRTDFPHSEWNDRVSSILLHTRTEIPIYEYSNFTGNSVKLTNLTHLPQLFDFISNNYNKKILSCERKAI
ncbi:hypothetical protein P4V71_29595 [Bacillus thuringiensis]|uniref:hypothetical protein n=1 Tax=Bacillus cereus group TaxID=86661 RepID=UPI00209BAA28|nr:hypothetical protein [Bacillus thuringiensis]MCU5281718.1 hypothetical protein [Bacillus cereus]MEC3269217.1 hypothetical protein [Bacillus thuringiensis]MED2067055.1 hypothetical protein [Bacillus thuringiensis]